MGAHVYILRCRDESYYTGRTVNVETRISEHNLGKGGDFTMRRRPVRLVWYYDFATEQEAYVVERQIKGWTRAKKEALIAGDFDLLVRLSKKKKMSEKV